MRAQFANIHKAFTKDGTLLASIDTRGVVKIWDMQNQVREAMALSNNGMNISVPFEI